MVVMFLNLNTCNVGMDEGFILFINHRIRSAIPFYYLLNIDLLNIDLLNIDLYNYI